MTQKIASQDLYKIQQPTECRLAPDGMHLSVVVTRSDREAMRQTSHLWLVSTRGGEARQFTQGKGNDSAPRFSPDGRSLAFLSSRSGKSEVWTIPMDGGEARQLTKLNGMVTDLAFSPNGKKLAIVFTPQDAEAKEREEKKKRGLPGQDSPKVRTIERIFYKLDGSGFLPKGRSHLYLVDVATGRARPLTDDDGYDEVHPVWSPDGKWVYFNSIRTADPDIDLSREHVWRMPARGGAIQKVRTFEGPSSGFSLSPDGRWLVFLGYEDPDAPWNTRHSKLWLAPARGGRPIELTARLDRACESSTLNDTFGTGTTPPPVWSPDSQWIYFIISNEGNSELWRVHIRDKRPEPVVHDPGVVIHYQIDFKADTIYASFADTVNPGEVVSFGLRKKQPPKVLSRFNAWLKDRTVIRPEEFWFVGKGRHKLQGWILHARRRSGTKGPAVLYIHGGPAAQYGRAFFHEFQYLSAKGYTVFYCNPRGGTGYSEGHLAAIHDSWGSVDFQDLMAFVDEALKRSPAVDRRRLGVAGGSYGGYMTNWIVGHTDRFAAAVTQRSVTNLMSFAGSSDFGYAWPRVFGGKPAWRDAEHYLRMSPITYADRIRTPILIEHQENDHRCPIEQAEQLFAALKVRKVTAEFHRYPDESHGMSRGGRPDRRIERLERIAGWFDRFLKVRGGAR